MRSFLAYKGFESDLTCRGFQYEIGKTYTIEGEPKLCERGFHCCLKLSDVFAFYSPIGYKHSVTNGKHVAQSILNTTRYCIVEVLGDVDNDCFVEMRVSTKIVTNEIKIVRELTYTEIITILEEELLSSKGCSQMIEGTLSELMYLNPEHYKNGGQHYVV